MEEKMGQKYRTWEELVEDKSHQQGDCRIWDAGTHAQGYPMAKWGDKMLLVSRKQMEDKLGRTLPKAERVKNRCGNKLCVNPDHYYVAQPGTEEWKCINFKYSAEQRKEIYDYFMSFEGRRGGISRTFEKFGISRATLYKFINENK